MRVVAVDTRNVYCSQRRDAEAILGVVPLKVKAPCVYQSCAKVVEDCVPYICYSVPFGCRHEKFVTYVRRRC